MKDLSSQSRPSTNSISNLDLLRALAVLIVFFAHLSMSFHIDYLWGVISVYEISQAGVMIFFVHTAFVLMLSLERQNESGVSMFRTFYIRRAFRIYPLSCLTILVVLAASIPSFPTETYHAHSLGVVLANLTLTQNFILNKSFPILNVLWSLPYEIQMYLALPFLFAVVRRRSQSVPFLIWGLTSIILLVVPIRGLGLLYFVPCFLGGVVGYRLWREPRFRLPAFFWVVAIAASIAMRLTLPHKIAPWFASLLLGMAIPQFREFRSPLIRRPSAFVAKYSYGIYLSHCPIIWLLLPGHYALLILFCTAVPVLLFHLVEDPMVRLGKLLTTGRSPSARLQKDQPASVTLFTTAKD